jgi:streptogramin lyase
MRTLLSLFHRPERSNTGPCPKRQPAHGRPAVEQLEDRFLPATINDFALPTLNAAPAAITRAQDGSLWFTEKNANKLGRYSTTGVLTEYAIPTPNSAPEQITAAADGKVWFTEHYGRKIGYISDTGGAITEFALTGVGEFPTAITATSTGVWFASNEQPNVARIGSITSAGAIHELPTAQSSTYVTSIVRGPDGNLWITNVSTQWGDSVAKVFTSGWGSYTYYRLPAGANPQDITVGPDNNLWLTEKNLNRIGRITTTGLITQFALSSGSGPEDIVAGPDGALWFTETTGNKIGRITTAGVITEYAVPTPSSQPFGITFDSDGDLCFTEQSGAKLGNVEL